MVGLSLQLIALLISSCLVVFMAVATWQGVAAIAEGIASRKLKHIQLRPCLQNGGLVVALFGLTFQWQDLAMVGLLLIALELLVSHGKPTVQSRQIELPLLGAALASLAGIAVVQAIAYANGAIT